MYHSNDIEEIAKKSPCFYHAIKNIEIESFMAARIFNNEVTEGYLICAEQRNLRIWQEEERATLFFAARMFATFINKTGMKMI